MISSLEVSNYRSVGPRVELLLGGLTALAGPNGAGKSNLLDAFQFLSDALRHGLESAVAERQGFAGIRRWPRGRPFDARFIVEAETNGEAWLWAFGLRADQRDEFRVESEFLVAHPASTLTPRPPRQAPPPPVPPGAPAASNGSSTGGVQSELTFDFDFDKASERLGSFELRDGAWLTPPAHDIRFAPAPRALALPEVAKLDRRFRPRVEELARIAVYSLVPVQPIVA
jgi:hypothetical protein